MSARVQGKLKFKTSGTRRPARKETNEISAMMSFFWSDESASDSALTLRERNQDTCDLLVGSLCGFWRLIRHRLINNERWCPSVSFDKCPPQIQWHSSVELWLYFTHNSNSWQELFDQEINMLYYLIVVYKILNGQHLSEIAICLSLPHLACGDRCSGHNICQAELRGRRRQSSATSPS